MAFPISWEVNVQVNYPGNSVWRKHNPSQVPFAAIFVVIHDILNLLLLSAQEKSANKEMPESKYRLQGWRLDGLDK